MGGGFTLSYQALLELIDKKSVWPNSHLSKLHPTSTHSRHTRIDCFGDHKTNLNIYLEINKKIFAKLPIFGHSSTHFQAHMLKKKSQREMENTLNWDILEIF